MMDVKEIKVNLRDLDKTNGYFKISLGNSFTPIDTSEISENHFVDDEIENSINDTIDYEKMRFLPFSGITEIVVNLMETGTTQMTYDTFGYNNGDVKFRRNRFKNSFLKLDFYDSPNPTNRKLAFQLIIYNQINEDQLDIDNNLLDVGVMPVTYRLIDPITIRRGISEGYYLYWLKNPTPSYPLNFYMYASYNNANDGISTQLVAYDNIVQINQYNSINFVKYTLSSNGSLQEYSIDNSNRTIDFSTNQMIINLYKPNLI